MGSRFGDPAPGGEAIVERIRRSPVGWGVALGAAVAFGSLFFIWIQVVSSQGDSERFRGIATFTGQSMMFAAVLAALAGIGIVASMSGWRVVFVVLALLMGALLTAAAVWALLDPVGFAKYSADAQIFSSMTAKWQGQDASDAVANAFASGKLDASARIGAIVGVAGGALTILGAILSFRRPARRVA